MEKLRESLQVLEHSSRKVAIAHITKVKNDVDEICAWAENGGKFYTSTLADFITSAEILEECANQYRTLYAKYTGQSIPSKSEKLNLDNISSQLADLTSKIDSLVKLSSVQTNIQLICNDNAAASEPIEYSDKEVVDNSIRNNSKYDDALYYVSNVAFKGADFYKALSCINCCFENLLNSYYEIYYDIDSRKIIFTICKIISSWYHYRYDESKYDKLNLISCCSNWLDCLLLYLSSCCMSATDSEEYIESLDKEAKKLVNWSITGGTYSQYIDSAHSFVQEKGRELPDYISQYALKGRNYQMFPATAKKLCIDQRVIEFAVLLENLIKPILFRDSISRLTDEEKESDKYLHSLRYDAASVLGINVTDSTTCLYDRYDYILGERVNNESTI